MDDIVPFGKGTKNVFSFNAPFFCPFCSAMSERCFALSETEVRQGFKRKNPEGMGAKARRFHSTRIHFFLLTHLFAKGGFFSN
jgi:hypothetical protein